MNATAQHSAWQPLRSRAFRVLWVANSVLPMILIFVFFQRYFVEGMTRSGLK